MFAECACGFMHVSSFLNVELRCGFKKKKKKAQEMGTTALPRGKKIINKNTMHGHLENYSIGLKRVRGL